MSDWWDLAIDWRRESERTGHGAVEASIGKFAAGRLRQPLTVRRAVMAMRLVEGWAADGRITAASSLRHAPISLLLSLQRIDRFDPAEVDKLLPALVTGTLKRRDVIRAERVSRAPSAPTQAGDPVDVPTDDPAVAGIDAGLVDLHRRRMAAPAFEARARSALLGPGSPMAGGRLQDGSPPGRVPALSMDALVIAGTGKRRIRHGVRFFAAAGDVVARRRAAQTLLLGLAAARYVDRFWAVVERADEAERLRVLADRVAPSGVGVLMLADGAAEVDVLLAATRAGRPDLVWAYDPLPPPATAGERERGGAPPAGSDPGTQPTQQVDGIATNPAPEQGKLLPSVELIRQNKTFHG